MRGIVKGEQCTAAWPLLQFFCRSGHYLADPVSASYLIQDIHSHLVAPSTVVASTVLGTGHKLGVGRYVLPTGNTAAWSLGTHRAVVSYVLSAGGPTLRQVVEFEVLSDVDWAGGGGDYCGYISTRQLYKDEYAVATEAAATLHQLVDKFSRQLEQWTAREFHPTRKSLYISGLGTRYMLLREPVIALEDMYYTWKDSDNSEQSQKIERYTYHVRARHLDGEVGRDSRILSMLELASSWVGDGWGARGEHWSWTDRSRNYRLDGVFGYTDGAMDVAGLRANIGRTPAPLIEVIGALVSRKLEDKTLSTPGSMFSGRIGTIKTRDQSISFLSGSDLASAVGSVFTGDPYLDLIISRYVAPTDVVPVGRAQISYGDADNW